MRTRSLVVKMLEVRRNAMYLLPQAPKFQCVLRKGLYDAKQRGYVVTCGVS